MNDNPRFIDKGDSTILDNDKPSSVLRSKKNIAITYLFRIFFQQSFVNI